MQSRIFKAIPWDMIAPHEQTARLNHYQSLKKLADRHGIDPLEAVAILEDVEYRKRWDCSRSLEDINIEAEKRLLELVAKYVVDKTQKIGDHV